MNPFAAEAIMKPDWPVVRSLSLASKAWPPPRSGASNMCTTIVSPGFIISVREFGVLAREVGQLRAGRTGRRAVALDEGEVDRFEAVVVAGGAVGAALEAVDGERRAPVGVVAADGVGERRKAGRVELKLDERGAGAGAGTVGSGALESEFGLHGRIGVELGSHTSSDIQGAMVSSK